MSYAVVGLVIFLTGFFEVWWFLVLMMFSLSIFTFSDCIFSVWPKKSTLGWGGSFSKLYPGNFITWGLHSILWTILNYLYSQYKGMGGGFLFFYKCPVVPALFVKEIILFPLNCICTFVRRELDAHVRVYLKTLHSVPPISVSKLEPVSLSHYYCSFKANPENKWCESCNLVFQLLSKLFKVFEFLCFSK